MDTHKRFRTSSLIITFIVAFALSGCLMDDRGDGLQPGPEEPAPCTASALCRLQNPADTLGLSSTQKAEVQTWFETASDSTVFALTTFDFNRLASDTVRIKLLSDLNVTIDSIGFMVTDSLSSAGVKITDWRGYIRGSLDGLVDLTFHNNQLESGYAVIGDYYITLRPLGGSKILVISQKIVIEIWPGGCSSGAKRAGTSLSCLD